LKTKDLALTAVFASLYYVLGIVFQPISFEAIQIRVACALIPLIYLFGFPATIGITIGHLAFNMGSPLGALDLLSPFVFLIPRLLIQRYGVKAMPVHTIAVGAWVAYIISTFGAPFAPVFLTVFAGELVAEWYLGYLLLYAAVEKRTQ
jgi:uncharacterized membrane protein